MSYPQYLLDQFLSQQMGLLDRSMWTRLYCEDAGQDLIEYALVGALLGLAALSAVKGLGTKIGSAFNTVTSNFNSDVS